MAIDLKAASPDTTIPATGAFLFGADSQAAAAPSVYRIDTTVLQYLNSLAHTITVNGALSAPATSLTGTWITGGSATTTKPQFLIEPSGTTSTGWSTAGTGIGVNAPSGFAGNILDLQVNGVSRFKYNPSGGILTITDPTASSSALDIYTGTFGSVPGKQVTFIYGARGLLALWGGNAVDESLMATGNGGFSWSAGANNAPDLFLRRDAANVLAQRNSTSAQAFRVYNTYTDASNYERGVVDFASTANNFTIGTEKAGTGTTRSLRFVVGGTRVMISDGTYVQFDKDVFVVGAANVSGVPTVCSGTATPAGGSTSARLIFGTTSGFGIYYGSGAPSVSAAQGSVYLRSDGSGTTDRMYINNSSGSGTTWTAVTTAA